MMNLTQAEQIETDLQSLAFHHKLNLHNGEQDENEDDEEFSFVCANPDASSPITADDAFYNGQIRPLYPLFDRTLLFEDETLPPPLRKVFLENPDTDPPPPVSSESEGVIEGTYCEWSPATAELGKKSNSTGFSKLWRFRDFMTMHRSSSDGEKAFVFLTNNHPSTTSTSSSPNYSSKNNNPHNHPQPQTSSSPHHTHYVKSRPQKKQVHKHKSYLPYRQDLVGFFTTPNGFTRNVHPY